MGSLTSKRMGGSGDDLPHQDESGCQKREGEPGWTLGWCLAGLFGRENDCEVHSTKIHQQITQALLGVYNQQISRLVNKSLTRAQVLEIKIPHKWRAPQLKGKWEIFWGGCCNTSIYWETCPSLQKRREMWGTVIPDFSSSWLQAASNIVQSYLAVPAISWLYPITWVAFQKMHDKKVMP